MVRIKHRYLLVNILYPDAEVPANSPPWTVQFHQPSSDRLDAQLLTRIIRDGVVALFGDHGAGMVSGSLQVKYFSPATSTAIVRVSRAYYRLVWAALSFVTKIPNPVNQPCVVQVVRVSGTIKKSEEEAIRRARSIILHARKTESVSSSITTGFTVLPSNLNQSSLDHDDVVHDIEDGIGDDDIDGDDDT